MAKHRASEDHTERINQLFERAGQLYEEGRYQEAIVHATQVRELMRQICGENHTHYATSLGDLAGRALGL